MYADKELKNKSGIYQIRNLQDGKLYIGSAIDLHKRKIQHFGRLRRKVHGNKHLQNAYNLYGKENFIFEVIEFVENKNKLLECEQYWMDRFLVYNDENGYNIQPRADRTKVAEETKLKLREITIPKSRAVICVETGIRYQSVYEAERCTGVDESAIRRCCSGKNEIAGGYHWYEENVGYIPYIHKPDNSIPVVCWETNVKYKNVKEASQKTGIDYSSILDVIHKKKHYHTAGGYHWYKKDDKISLKDIYLSNKNKKPILRLEDNKIFFSVNETANECNINRRIFENIDKKAFIKINNFHYVDLRNFLTNDVLYDNLKIEGINYDRNKFRESFK